MLVVSRIFKNSFAMPCSNSFSISVVSPNKCKKQMCIRDRYVCLNRADTSPYITIQISVLKRCLPDGEFLFSADVRNFVGILFAQICTKLIINLQKQLRILRIGRKFYDIADRCV